MRFAQKSVWNAYQFPSNWRSIWGIQLAVGSREQGGPGIRASNGDHMHRPRHPRRLRLIGSLAVGITAVTTALATAQPSSAATNGQPPLQGAAARQSALYHYLKTGASAVASPRVTPTEPTNTHQGDDGDLADCHCTSFPSDLPWTVRRSRLRASWVSWRCGR